jgi:hypothetical protein
MARNAYRLLSNWKTPPGSQKGGGYNGQALTAWLDEVKAICRKSGHLEIALSRIGHVLNYTPPDPNGLWLHQTAAAALNARDADDMRDGFRNELYNSRGVHYVDPSGKPERELVAKYRAQAEAVEEAGYPRLATTLRELAEEYEREAERIVSRETFDD